MGIASESATEATVGQCLSHDILGTSDGIGSDKTYVSVVVVDKDVVAVVAVIVVVFDVIFVVGGGGVVVWRGKSCHCCYCSFSVIMRSNTNSSSGLLHHD